ncbi:MULTISPECIES: hypothetical protein [unclassified Streptomyces]
MLLGSAALPGGLDSEGRAILTVHVGARVYDPGLGRFLSVDPLLEPGNP